MAAPRGGSAAGDRSRPPRPHALRRYGQNHLVDANILRVIVDQAAVGPDDVVLEVGAAGGLLTRPLVERARLVHALIPYWAAHVWLVPGLEFAEAVLAIAEPDEDPLRASQLMIDASSLAAGMGLLGRARSLAMAAARLAQRVRLLEAEINALATHAFCELLDGEPAVIVSELERLLERAVQAGLTLQQSRLLSFLGQARAELGELDAARHALERARRLAQELGNPMGEALETINLAFVAVLSTDATEACRLLGALARTQPPIDHHVVACFTLFTVGCLARLEGQWARCLRAHLAALRHYESGGVADSRLRRREREHDIERARQALDPATCAATEREAATGSIQSDLAWALAGAGRGAGSTSLAEIGIPPANR